VRLSGSQLQWDPAPEGQPGGENLPRGDNEASLAERLTGHQAQLKGRRRLVEEVAVEVIPDKRSMVGAPVSVFRTLTCQEELYKNID
jgi:hypothetical protein